MTVSVRKLILTSYMNRVLKKENVYKNKECSLKYLFIEKKKSDRLLVVFSGFPPEGKKGVYNYVLKFRDLNCNKLYILDDFGNDGKGSYYLGENKNMFIERAVSELIDFVAHGAKIQKDKIMTAGSSKGGYAALYFAFKYGYGTALSGAPQVLLGNYLSHPANSNVMSYICGDIKIDDINYLNRVLLDVIKDSEHSPALYLHVSANEHHYKDHMIPLIELLDSKGIKRILDLATYDHHGEVGRHFPMFARNMIQRKLTGHYDDIL